MAQAVGDAPNNGVDLVDINEALGVELHYLLWLEVAHKAALKDDPLRFGFEQLLQPFDQIEALLDVVSDRAHTWVIERFVEIDIQRMPALFTEQLEYCSSRAMV